MGEWKECVIDASLSREPGDSFCFCPIEGDLDGDFKVVTGLSFISSVPPAGFRLVAIIHPDGQAAVDDFCRRFSDDLEALEARLSEPAPDLTP